MKVALPPGRLAAMWAGLEMRAGAFKACEASPRVVDIGDKRMVITRCEFHNGAFDIQFAFDAAARISGLVFRPVAAAPSAAPLPPYARAGSYSESPIAIGSGPLALPGTLTLPAGDATIPAVVLVHGSGPQDRDSTVGPNKPFRDLAAGLASRGIAVLRYDKRTYVHRRITAALGTFTVKDEVIDDVVIAVKALRAQPRINGTRIFVLGHSLGGMLVPRIAAADSSVAGFVIAAGAATSIEDAMVAQATYLASVDGTISADERTGIETAQAFRQRVRGLTTAAAASGEMLAGAPASYWLDLRGYDPPLAARAINAPLLLLQGERDFQVTLDDFAKWKTALGSRRDATFRSYPALNHLLIAGSGPSLPAEYQTPGHVAGEVVRDITEWILAIK